MDKTLLPNRLDVRRVCRWQVRSLVILSGSLLLGAPEEIYAYGDVEHNDAQLREEAREVVSRYARDFDEYVKALHSKTPEERDQAIEKRPGPVPSGASLVGWAERNPKEPVAADLKNLKGKELEKAVEQLLQEAEAGAKVK